MPGAFIMAIVFGLMALATTLVWRNYKQKLVSLTSSKTAETSPGREVPDSLGDYGRGVRERGYTSTSSPDTTTENEKVKKLLTSIVKWLKYSTIALYILAALFVLWSSYNPVSTKNVGVVSTFGAPGENLDNGLHFVLPWQKVTELDAAIQTDSHAGQDDTPCITVRIARQATACVDISVRWQLQQSSAHQVFQDYREFSNLRESLVTRELGATSTEVFKEYDALAVDADGNSTAPSNDKLSQQATTILQNKAGGQILILNVIVNHVGLDEPTQRKLNEQNAELANTRIATQKQKTAEAQADANGKLADSLSKDPNVLVSRCYDLWATAIDKNYQLPAGSLVCWPGSQSALVLPGVGGNKPN